MFLKAFSWCKQLQVFSQTERGKPTRVSDTVVPGGSISWWRWNVTILFTVCTSFAVKEVSVRASGSLRRGSSKLQCPVSYKGAWQTMRQPQRKDAGIEWSRPKREAVFAAGAGLPKAIEAQVSPSWAGCPAGFGSCFGLNFPFIPPLSPFRMEMLNGNIYSVSF